MMNKKLLVILLTAGSALIVVTTGLHAGNEVPDTITMDYNKYNKRKKAPPKFKYPILTHKKHAEDYKISCGNCHHDKDNKPLDLKPGDTVQKCVECHTKLERSKKKKKGEKKDIMVLEYAMHENCIVCHKDVNKKAGDPKGKKGPAPASCGKCHISIKKK